MRRHYTWSGSGGPDIPYDKTTNGYEDVATGEFISFGNGEQPNDYDLQVPTTGGVFLGGSPKRIADSNNTFALDSKRETGGTLGVEEGSSRPRYPIQRVAKLVPSVSSRLS